MSSRVYVPKNQLCRTNFQRESRFEKYKDFEEKKTPLQEEQKKGSSAFALPLHYYMLFFQ